MSILFGSKLGPYEILEPLGAGEMGEVYRARDTRLGREVALKVLPSHFNADPGFRQRFEREAHVISSLNHPHVCTLYDVGARKTSISWSWSTSRVKLLRCSWRKARCRWNRP